MTTKEDSMKESIRDALHFNGPLYYWIMGLAVVAAIAWQIWSAGK